MRKTLIMKKSKTTDIYLDLIKGLNKDDFNKEEDSYFRFNLSLDYAKLILKLKRDNDVSEFLNTWIVFAYRYYPIGRKIIHVPHEFHKEPSRYEFIIYQNLFEICEQLKIENPAINDEWFSSVYFGFISLSMGNIPDACEMFSESLAFDSSYAEIWSFLGYAFFRKGDIDDAKKSFELSIALDPRFYGNYILLISCYKQLGLFERIIDLSDKALMQFPEEWCLMIESAHAAKSLGDNKYYHEMRRKAINSLLATEKDIKKKETTRKIRSIS